MTNGDRIRQMTDEELAEFLDKDALAKKLEVLRMTIDEAINHCIDTALSNVGKELTRDAGSKTD